MVRLVGWSVGRSGRLVGWSVGWSVGRLVCSGLAADAFGLVGWSVEGLGLESLVWSVGRLKVLVWRWCIFHGLDGCRCALVGWSVGRLRAWLLINLVGLVWSVGRLVVWGGLGLVWSVGRLVVWADARAEVSTFKRSPFFSLPERGCQTCYSLDLINDCRAFWAHFGAIMGYLGASGANFGVSEVVTWLVFRAL